MGANSTPDTLRGSPLPPLFGKNGKTFTIEGGSTPLTIAAKKRIMRYMHWHNTQLKRDGQHIGPLTRVTLDVAEALLFKFHNTATGFCFPSYEAIAAAANCGLSAVREAIKALREAGILDWKHWIRRVSGAVVRLFRRANVYRFIDPGPAFDDPGGSRKSGGEPRNPQNSENRAGTQNQQIQETPSAERKPKSYYKRVVNIPNPNQNCLEKVLESLRSAHSERYRPLTE